jgi:hypothetical protein
MTQAQLRDLAALLQARQGTARPDNIDRWAAVITDLEHQVARPESTTSGSQPEEDRALDDVRRRQARAALRRWVQVRGRQCAAPGCRVPAIKTDQDHLIDWILGGPTAEANLSLLCRHDHRAKHEGGWRATMPEPGVIDWTSPLGHRYRVHPPPIMSTIPTAANTTPRQET